MSRRRPGDDDELEDPTADARALLESGESEAGNKRRMSRSDEYLTPSERPDPTRFGALETAADDEKGVFAKDDLDVADEVAGEHSDSLTRKVALRGKKWQDLDRQAPFARINPPSVLKGTLGGQQLVYADDPLVPPPNGGHVRQQVALWGGDDAETLPVTVVLAPVSPRVAGSLSPPLPSGYQPPGEDSGDIPYGIVKFGTRGMAVQVEVDIGLGTQFTIGASFVSVEVALELANTSGAFPLGSLNLAGMLSFYPIVRTVPLTRTKAVIVGVPPAFQIIQVPNFAKDVRFVGFAIGGAATLTLGFINAGIGTQYQYDIAVPAFGTGMTAANGVLFSVPITGDIVAVQLSGTRAIDGRLIFGLSM